MSASRSWSQIPAELWGQLAQESNQDDQLALPEPDDQEPDRG